MTRLLEHLRSRMTDAEFQLYCEDFITGCAFTAMLVLGWWLT